MTALEYLSGIRKYDAQIRYRQGELERLGGSADSMAYPSVSGGASVGSPNISDKIGNVVVTFADLEREITELQGKRKEIIGKIEALPDADAIEILLWKYAHDNSLSSISRKVGYCYRHIKRKHRNALDLFSETYDFD